MLGRPAVTGDIVAQMDSLRKPAGYSAEQCLDFVSWVRYGKDHGPLREGQVQARLLPARSSSSEADVQSSMDPVQVTGTYELNP